MTPQQRATNDREWHREENWSGFGIYSSDVDSRTWVPKRNPGLGWSVNIARTPGRLWLLAILGLPIVLVAFTVWRRTS